MLKQKKFLILFLALAILLLPGLSFAKDKIELESNAVISETGLIEVFISNDNPQDLKLKAEYGEYDPNPEKAKLDLKSNTFSFQAENYGYGTATLTALRKGVTYQYRLFDTAGVLDPSDIYYFTTNNAPVYMSSVFLPEGQLLIPDPLFIVYNVSSTIVNLHAVNLNPGYHYKFKTNTFTGEALTEVIADNIGSASGSLSGLTPGTIYTVNLFEFNPNTKQLSNIGAPTVKFRTLADQTPEPDPVTLGTTDTPDDSEPTPPGTSGGSKSSNTNNAPTTDRLVSDTCGKMIGGELVDGEIVGGQFVECGFDEFLDLVARVVKFILFDLAIPIAAIMFLYAGFLMVTAGDESAGARTKAKSIFTNALIGLTLAAGAWVIVHTLLEILGYHGSWIGF